MYLIKYTERKIIHRTLIYVDNESECLLSVYSIWYNNLILYRIFCQLNNKIIIVFYKCTIIILFIDGFFLTDSSL